MTEWLQSLATLGFLVGLLVAAPAFVLHMLFPGLPLTVLVLSGILFAAALLASAWIYSRQPRT